jgi:hypothetical protein
MKEQIEVPALVGDIALQMENSDCTPMSCSDGADRVGQACHLLR